MKSKVYIVFFILILLVLSACSTSKTTLNTNSDDSSSSQETETTNNATSSKKSDDSSSSQETETTNNTTSSKKGADDSSRSQKTDAAPNTESSVKSDDSSSSQKTDDSTGDADINTSSIKEETKSVKKDTSSVEEAFKGILENKVSFIKNNCYKEGEEDYLNDYMTNYLNTSIVHMTLNDLDGDQTPELILEFSNDEGYGAYPVDYEVFHYNNGKVYGYLFGLRGFEELKEDGTFRGSDSAAESGVYKIVNFKLPEAEEETLGETNYKITNDGTVFCYFINNTSVTKEDYDAFSKQQDAKQDVKWYDVSVDNLEKLWSGGSLNDSLSNSLCAENEEVLFSFNIANSDKILSICTSKDSDYIVYRYGTKGNIELEYPENKKDSWSKFLYSYRNNEGVDLNSLTFQNGSYEYKIYDNYNEEDSEERKVGITVTDISSGKETEIKGESSSRKGSLSDLRDNEKIKITEY